MPCVLTAVSSCVVGAGMVVDWEQETGLLMTSGDVRVVRIWDTEREMKVQVLNAPSPGLRVTLPGRRVHGRGRVLKLPTRPTSSHDGRRNEALNQRFTRGWKSAAALRFLCFYTSNGRRPANQHLDGWT